MNLLFIINQKLLLTNQLMVLKHSFVGSIQKGLIMPDIFIPFAESTSLISDIGRFVLMKQQTVTRMAKTRF
jgi:EAL domain-containing protein (putative c-di-GMP-specific phosphodiesterase class I)